MNETEHSEILEILLDYVGITVDDLKGLANVSKGIGWRKILNFLQKNCEDETKTLMNKFEKLRKAGSDISALNIPNVTWDDIGGLLEAKQEIIDTIMLPQWYPEYFKGSIKPRTGILFFGPPGTGKTLLAKAVATECKMNFLSVKGPELLNMYVGESEKNVRDIFNKARNNLPCIIFFDELDALVPNRGQGSDSNSVMDRIVAQFLTEVDGLGKEAGLFVIGATNRPDLLDPSLLRPGRFDKMVYLGINEDKDSRMKILIAQTRKYKLAKDVNLEELESKIPKNFTGADFYALTSAAILKTVKRKIKEIDEKFEEFQKTGDKGLTFEEWSSGLSDEETDLLVSQNDFLEVLPDIKPSVTEDDLVKFKELRKKYSLSNNN